MLPPGAAAGISLPQPRTFTSEFPRAATSDHGRTEYAARRSPNCTARQAGWSGVAAYQMGNSGQHAQLLNPADSVRVVGFDLTGQRETVLRDGFTLKDISGAVHLGDVKDRARIQLPAGTHVQQSLTAIVSPTFAVDSDFA